VRRQLALAVDEPERLRWGAGRLSVEGGVRDAAADPPARRVVAAFDFDGTLADRDTLLPFLVRAFGRARVAASFAALGVHGLRTLAGRSTIDEFKVRVLRRLFAGERVDRLRALGAEHARAVVPWLRPQGLERLAWHRAQGHAVWLVSATLDLYLDDVAAALGLPPPLCTRLATRVGEDGVERFDGRLAGADCTGDEKLRRLAAAVGGLADVELHAYGDGAGDRALLAAARHPHHRPFRGAPAPGRRR
jgi:HAD superfamily hydrolase (TIGR01490 family)